MKYKVLEKQRIRLIMHSFSGISLGKGGFSYHQFNVDSNGNPSYLSAVYDACLAVDGGEAPGDGISGKEKHVFVVSAETRATTLAAAQELAAQFQEPVFISA